MIRQIALGTVSDDETLCLEGGRGWLGHARKVVADELRQTMRRSVSVEERVLAVWNRERG